MTVKTHTGRSLKIRELNGQYRSATTDEIIHAARSAINRQFRRGRALSKPADSQEYMKLHLAHLQHEVFAVLWLDNRHRILGFEELFRGTIDGASVHPREIVKAALSHNAAACILAHNHPSGVSEPSRADTTLTRRLCEALSLVDVRVLDHIVVGVCAARDPRLSAAVPLWNENHSILNGSYRTTALAHGAMPTQA